MLGILDKVGITIGPELFLGVPTIRIYLREILNFADWLAEVGGGAMMNLADPRPPTVLNFHLGIGMLLATWPFQA